MSSKKSFLDRAAKLDRQRAKRRAEKALDEENARISLASLGGPSPPDRVSVSLIEHELYWSFLFKDPIAKPGLFPGLPRTMAWTCPKEKRREPCLFQSPPSTTEKPT